MPKLTKYNGKPVIVLDPEVKLPAVPFSFGISKARVIMEKLNEIENYLLGLSGDKENKTSKIESIREKHSRQELDLTPEVNQTGKKFKISKCKARLIMKFNKEIQEFIENNDKEFNNSIRKEKEEFLSSRSFTPEIVKNPWGW